MAYRPKPASYYFRENKPGEEWFCTKFLGAKGGDSSEPSDTYIIRLDGKKRICSCPAAWGGRKSGGHDQHVDCKHLGYLTRWETLYESGRVSCNTVVYLNSADDRFYPVPGLAEIEQAEELPKVNEGDKEDGDGGTEKKDRHPGAAFMGQDE